MRAQFVPAEAVGEALVVSGLYCVSVVLSFANDGRITLTVRSMYLRRVDRLCAQVKERLSIKQLDPL